MSTFSVQTEALVAASAVVARASLDANAGGNGLGTSAGALDGTPAMAAFAMFVGSAQSAAQSVETATGGLARALNEAAMAYVLADGSAAASVEVKR
jgi:hypothetical protein